MKLALQSDKRKTPQLREYRYLTRDEILALRPGSRPAVILNNGRVGTATVNGAVRTWKQDANRVEVPVKYGMYEYATFDLVEALCRFVVEAPEEGEPS